MSKVLLINPQFNIAKAKYDSSLSVGLLSIGTFLDSKGVPLKIIDAARQDNYEELLDKEIEDCHYAALAVMTSQIPAALEISRRIRAGNPNCVIIWGGSHPTFFPEQTAAHPLVDIVCVGEGEETMLKIIEGKNSESILGIAYKTKSGVAVNSPRPLHDPARMPLFKWDLISPEVLNNLSLIPSLTSRGCPHRCAFCINAILKNRWRPRTVDQVLEDLRIVKSKEYFKDKKLRFWDENFFVDINRAKAIIEGMIRYDLVIPWETTIRSNYIREGMVDDEFMARIRQSGCYLLSFGAESGSPDILKKIQKDITDEEILNSARLCLKHGIIPQYSFMLGLPGETKKDMKQTINLIDKLTKLSGRVQILGPQAFRPYPGSSLYEECVAAGWQAPQSLEEWGDVIKNELSYLTVKNFPWVKEKDFVESMEAYVRFGAHSIKRCARIICKRR